MLTRSTRPTLFPYTTLFRSVPCRIGDSGVSAAAARPLRILRRLALAGRQAMARPGESAEALAAIHQISGHWDRDLVAGAVDRKSTRLNSSHVEISYAVFCLK